MATNFAYLTSADPGAPALDGTAGSLITLLDHVLDVANTTDGWEKVYTGADKAVYRPRVGNRPYLRVLDDGSANAQGAREAEVRCYESMSDVDTGTDPFPTLAQFGAGLFVIRKSNSADATAREWKAVRTSRYLLLVVQWNTGSTASVYVVGDLPTALKNDPYASFIGAREGGLTNQNNGTDFTVGLDNPWHSSITTSISHGFWMRSPDGVGKSVHGLMRTITTASGALRSYPDASGDLQFMPCDALAWTGSGNSLYPRAAIPNLVVTPYNSGISNGDVWAAGARSFVAHRLWNPIYGIETTDTGGAL